MSRFSIDAISLILCAGSALFSHGLLAAPHAAAQDAESDTLTASLNCDVATLATRFQARYQITTHSGDNEQHQQLTLTRFDDTIIYQHNAISFEAWQKNGEYVRYFPQYKRSISYRRSDLLALNIDTDLDQQFHLLSPAALTHFDGGEHDNQGCFATRHYQRQSSQQSLDLNWIEDLALPASLTVHKGKRTTHYRLLELAPMTQTDFHALTSGYQDLDFADVGDSEADPFIAKMITQGFIQHGSSGFYSADGQALKSGHGDHHH